jgi:hypothetical protein
LAIRGLARLAGGVSLLRGARRGAGAGIRSSDAGGLAGAGGRVPAIILILLIDREKKAERHHQDRSANRSGQSDARHQILP